jgi:hypothetical protein
MKKNHHYLYKYLLGLLFGFGIIYSGMVYPSKVINFLDITGNFDPSLIFVMLGGILVYSVFFFLTKNKNAILGYDKNIPKNTAIDRKLIIGSVMFGVGWGLVGYCPAPALVGLGVFNYQAILFVVSMLLGMLLFKQAKI